MVEYSHRHGSLYSNLDFVGRDLSQILSMSGFTITFGHFNVHLTLQKQVAYDFSDLERQVDPFGSNASVSIG